MIKALFMSSGEPTLFIGLGGENIKRLRAGEPIVFDLGVLGAKIVPDHAAKQGGGVPNGVKVVIAAGENEVALAKEWGLPNLGAPEPGVERRVFFDSEATRD